MDLLNWRWFLAKYGKQRGMDAAYRSLFSGETPSYVFCTRFESKSGMLIPGFFSSSPGIVEIAGKQPYDWGKKIPIFKIEPKFGTAPPLFAFLFHLFALLEI